MAKARLVRNFDFRKLIPSNRPGMVVAAQDIHDRVVQRTLNGRDENGQPFAPYANGHYKGKRRPDLWDSGYMFSKFKVTKVTGTGFTISFTTKKAEDIARFHMEGTKGRTRTNSSRMLAGSASDGGLPPRPFLGIPEHWIDDVKAKWLKTIPER